MNYHEFVRIVEKEINYNLEGGMKASIYSTIKNNSQKRIGIIMESPGSCISPTIYLEEFYEKYLNGKGICEITGDILRIYEKSKCEKMWNPENLIDYEKISGKIVFKIINTKQNEELLQKVPHIEFLDLSIVFYVLLEATQEGTATMLIYEENLEQWGIGPEELIKRSVENVKRLLPAQLFSMEQVIKEVNEPWADRRENLLEGKNIDENERMYVLSNSIRSFGAACMVYPGMLKMLGDILKTDFYVLPSSIHEVILVPYKFGMSFRQMCDMVVEVNESQVMPEEVLSDHAYFYNRKREKLMMTEG